MGNLLGKSKKQEPQDSRNERISSSNFPTHKPVPLPLPPQITSGQSSNTKKPLKKYALIQDNFTTLEQVYMFHL